MNAPVEQTREILTHAPGLATVEWLIIRTTDNEGSNNVSVILGEA